MLATVMLAAGGYIINDYFDLELDKNSDKQKFISEHNKNKAMNWYIALTVVAILIGFFISFKIETYKLGYIYIIIAGMLWFYSANYQRSFLIGNIIVALLTALVPLIVLPYEILLQYRINDLELIGLGTNLNEINFWVLGFSAFAFLMTLIREIIKDTEDHDADIMQSFNTLPIVFGIKGAKIVITILSVLVIVALYVSEFMFINFSISVIYISVFIVVPILFMLTRMIKSESSKDFNYLSKLSKLIILAGILYTFIVFLKY